MSRNSAGSHSQSHFSRIPSMNMPRSRFDRSHGHKTAHDEGFLYPIFVEEALPGDTMELTLSHLTRLATPLHPFMDNITIDFHFFSVPNRLVWDNWEKFCGSQDNPADSTDFLVPQIVATGAGFAEDTLYDFMGFPTKKAGVSVSALYNRAYYLIWNEWYRDENLQPKYNIITTDANQPMSTYEKLLERNKRKDYFTSALPWPQKGPTVLLPLGSSAPVIGDGTYPFMHSPSLGSFRNIVAKSGSDGMFWDSSMGSASSMQWGKQADPSLTGLKVDLSDATAATINQLREAFQLQALFELDARGGTRYVEILLAHFGVQSPDFRLQRPEYIGGGSSVINVNPIAQTNATADGSTPQGNLAAFAVSSKTGIGFTHSFVEHCLVFGFASVRADMTYQQGLNRMFSRKTRFDYYWPLLANLGEQSVLNKEIYAQGTAGGTDDDEIFGYQERWAEYRYKPSQVTGAMRSNHTLSLDTWHLAYDFDELPTLSPAFMYERPPIERVVSVTDQARFISDYYFRFYHTRPLPTYSVPVQLGRL